MNMFHKHLSTVKYNTAVDDTLLSEIIHPVHRKNDPQVPYSLSYAQLDSGKQSLLHKLSNATETYIITAGNGIIKVGSKKEKVSKGSIIVVPPNTQQNIHNTGKTRLCFYCIVSPPWNKKLDMKISPKE